MGQLTSPLCSQKCEVSANPFGVPGSQQQAAASSNKHLEVCKSLARSRSKEHREKPVRGAVSFPSPEKPVSKGERNRELESVQLSQMEKRKILSEQKSLHKFVEKLDELFKENLQLRQDNLESQRVELNQENQLTDQAQREKSWLFGELGVTNGVFQEDRANDCQEIQEVRRIC